MSLPIALLVAVLTLAAAPLAAWRSGRQPVAVDTDAEDAVLAALDADPALAAALELTAEDFTATRADRFATHLVAAGPADDTAEKADLPEDLARAVASVRECAWDRTTFPGRTPVEATGDPARPLRRHRAPVAWGRALVLAAIAGTVGGLVAPGLDPLATVAVVVWLLTGALIAMVDLDTLFLDTPTHHLGYGAAWTLVVANALATDQLPLALVGAFTGAFLAGGLWLVAHLYSRLRSRTGLGSGDVILVFSTVGIPTALGASANLGPVSVLIGCGFALAAFAIEARRRGTGIDTPFAFGPSLVLGAAVAWPLLGG